MGGDPPFYEPKRTLGKPEKNVTYTFWPHVIGTCQAI